MTEEKDRHPATLVNRIVDHLRALADTVPTLVLMGNHDYHNEGSPFFQFIRHIPNLTWVDSVTAGTELENPFLPHFHGTLLLPHTRNYKRDWGGIIETKAFKHFDNIFAHNTFNGATVGFGRELEGIPLEVFPKNANVYAGDIHVPQTLGPVTYIGSPYSVDFGDAFAPRMLGIQGDRRHSVDLSSFPQKRLIEAGTLAEIFETDGLHGGDILKVRLNVEDMSTWAKTHKEISDWAIDQGYVPFRIEPIISKSAIKKRHKLTASQSDGELLTSYAKRTGLTKETLKVGMEFL